MAKRSIKTRLWTNVGIQIVMMLLVGSIGFWITSQLNGGIKDLAQVQIPAERDMGLLDMHHEGMKGVALSAIIKCDDGDKAGVKRIRGEFVENSKQMGVLFDQLLSYPLSEKIKEEIRVAKRDIDAYLLITDGILSSAEALDPVDARSKLPVLEKSFLALEESLSALGEDIEKTVQEHAKQYSELAKIADWLGILTMILGFIVGVGIAYPSIRNLTKTLFQVNGTLSGGAGELDVSSHQILRSSEVLNSSTNQQASSVHEISATLEEFTAMINRGGEHADKTSALSKESLDAALEGKNAVDDMINAISDINTANTTIMEQMTESNKKISEIVGVINEINNKTKVINDIVFQTKLLSFNASVEAARAGEHGKGFSVVAEEVGNLANMSGAAAKEIADLVEGSKAKVTGIVDETKSKIDGLVSTGKVKIDHGITVAQLCGETLDRVLGNVRSVVGMMEELNATAKEQSSGISNISEAMNQFTETTQANAEVARESSELALGLKKLSSGFQKNLSVLAQELGLSTEILEHHEQVTSSDVGEEKDFDQAA